MIQERPKYLISVDVDGNMPWKKVNVGTNTSRTHSETKDPPDFPLGPNKKWTMGARKHAY